MTAGILRDCPALRRVKIVVFTLAGLGLMIGTMCWAISAQRFVARAASAPGVVVRLNAGGAHPQVRFTAAAGQVIEYPQGGMIWGYRVGDAVQVLYDPQAPATDPVLNTPGALWGFTATNFLMGVVFVLMAQFVWRRPHLIG